MSAVERCSKAEYRRRYNLIAQDFLAFYRETGRNKWMEEEPAYRAWTVQHVKARVAPGSRILDAGCAAGLLMSDLASDYQVTGVDVSSVMVDYARSLGLDAHVGWLEHLPFKTGWFDAVVCTDVLEHVLEPGQVAGELRRVLKSDGVFVVRVPKWDLTNVGGGGSYDFPIHLQAFTAETLASILDTPVVLAEERWEELLVVLQ